MRPAASAARVRTFAFRALNRSRKSLSQRRSSSARTISKNRILDTGSPEVGFCSFRPGVCEAASAIEKSSKAHAVSVRMPESDSRCSVLRAEFICFRRTLSSRAFVTGSETDERHSCCWFLAGDHALYVSGRQLNYVKVLESGNGLPHNKAPHPFSRTRRQKARLGHD